MGKKPSNAIFIDTSFIIGLINEQDDHHIEAQNLAKQYQNYHTITTDAILLELGNALAKRFRIQSVTIIHYFLDSPNVTVISLDPFLFKRALAFYQNHQDKSWGLVDCLSFVIMKEMNIINVLTFDRHFTQAGFHQLS